MRWIPFVILLFFATAMQTVRLGGFPRQSQIQKTQDAGVSEAQGVPEQTWPYVEIIMLLAVFYGLYAPEAEAPLAGLACGLAYDIAWPGDFIYVGTNLIPMALTVWLIVRVRKLMFREHVLAQMLVTLLAVAVFAILSVIYRRIIGAPLEGGSVWRHLGFLLGNGVYTAVVSPVVFYFLMRMRGLLGFAAQRSRMASRGFW